MDWLARFWNQVALRAIFECAQLLLGRWALPLSEWLVAQAASHFPPHVAQDFEQQWLADLFELPAWLKMRSAVSLFLSYRVVTILEGPLDVSSKVATTRAVKPLRNTPTVALPVQRYDAVTGLLNRSHLTRRLDRSLANCLYRRKHLAVVLVCVDNFQTVNQELGRSAGDAVLRIFTRRIRIELRGRGLVGRYGEDQFAVMLPNATPSAALEIAETIRGICDFRLRAINATFHISASLGVAAIAPKLNGEDLWSNADVALDRARQGGRNRVCQFATIPCHA